MPRKPLPQTSGATFLTDSGIETEILFREGRDLPEFAVFPLLRDDEGRAILERYYRSHVDVASSFELGYVFETPSYRSSSEWGARLGYSPAELADLDREGVAFLESIRASSPAGLGNSAISGLIGPRGDGYVVDQTLTANEAREYHGAQVAVFTDAGCDLVTACTMTHAGEAQGIAAAARDCDVPAVIYFTLETDGRLPDGSRLADAIRQVDDATDSYVTYFGINCAHPDHIALALDSLGDQAHRIGALRANASRLSHAELDVAEELDSGDPVELAGQYATLRNSLPTLNVFGGCCGTGVEHVQQIARAVSV